MHAGVRWTWIVAVWCGLLAGIGEALIVAVKEHGFHMFVTQSRDHLWMAPIADVLFFSLVAIPVSIAVRVLPRLMTRRLVGTGFLALGLLAILLNFPRIHVLATVALALGIAARLGLLVVLPERRLGNQLLAMATGVALTAVVVSAVRAVRERRAFAALPPVESGAPNVLLLILDTVQAPRLSLYGYGRRTTPNLEQWARRGIVFDRAFSTAPWTLPSHSTMFTGRPPAELSADWLTPLDGSASTIAEIFQARGYATAGFVANMLYTGHDSGLDRGFIHYEDYLRGFEQLTWSTALMQTTWGVGLHDARTVRQFLGAFRRFDLRDGDVLGRFQLKHAPAVANGFLRWREQHKERPYFAFLNYFDAHTPYDIPQAFAHRFSKSGMATNIYDGAVAYLDQEVDKLLKELDRAGALENTIVIITSDHGEYFGQHRLFGHGIGVHKPVLHVPLLFIAKGRVPSGVRIKETVSLRDLPSTILQLTGAGEQSVPGKSLVSRWQSDGNVGSTGLNIAFAELTNAKDARIRDRAKRRTMAAVVTDDLYWVRSYDGKEELYARADTAEVANLSADSTVRARLQSELAASSASLPRR